MRVIKFPYTFYKNTAGPIIRISVKGKKEFEEIWVFVDSGATFSIFSFAEAEKLNIDPKIGEKCFVVVGDGSYIPVWKHKLLVKIGSKIIKATIGFSDRLGVGFNLLGREDIFEKFDVAFSDSRKEIVFSVVNK